LVKRSQIIALGDLEVDLAARRVTRDGRELELGKLSFDLLEALIRAAPAALSNDEIVERVWAGDAVTDENIKQRVSLLRRALGQRPGREYVETLRGFGYRLAGEAPILAPAGAGEPQLQARQERLARRLLLLLAIVSLLLLITVLAIAVRRVKRVPVGAPASAVSAAAPGSGPVASASGWRKVP
jgi:DNA-binding winged helix-turn-helix (wHTH) protein